MKQDVDFEIVVIGGGIVGLASAYKISLAYPGIGIAVLEKEGEVGSHQTGHNSGVIHSGLYYKPGSGKARRCTAGRRELVRFAEEQGLGYEVCGKLVVATRERELGRLNDLFERGRANGVEGIEKIGTEQIVEIEPACRGIAAIKVPCTGIIDFVGVARRLAELIEAGGEGNVVLTGQEVVGLERHDFYTRVITERASFRARYLLNCAGLQSDRVAEMDGVDPGVRIVPFRGDYYELREEAREKVRGLIYPVPDPAVPFLGVHFTRMIDGSVECGPSAVFSFKREGYGKMEFSLRDCLDSLGYVGTWRLFLRHWRYGLGEYARAFSRGLLLRQLRRLVPSLGSDDIRPGKTGVRAQAVGPRGELVDDFKIERRGNSIHVLNAPSPAATACLAIGDYISELSGQYFGLVDKLVKKQVRSSKKKRKSKGKGKGGERGK